MPSHHSSVPSSGPFVYTLDKEQIARFKAYAIDLGPQTHLPPSVLATIQSPGLRATLYQTGKVVIQGKAAQSWIEFTFEPQISLQFIQNTSPTPLKNSLPLLNSLSMIGSDEAGKGDYFGPLCISSVYVEAKLLDQLTKIGIRDSKLLKDKNIPFLASEIRKHCPYESLTLSPAAYNLLYEKIGNLNKIMMWGHRKCIKSVIEKISHPPHNIDKPHVMIDQFTPNKYWLEPLLPLGLIAQETKAERYIAVAAASILSRDNFLSAMQKIEEKLSTPIPKGAGKPVDLQASILFREIGASGMLNFVKWHFANTKKIQD